jgi:hypothetical protein
MNSDVVHESWYAGGGGQAAATAARPSPAQEAVVKVARDPRPERGRLNASAWPEQSRAYPAAARTRVRR